MRSTSRRCSSEAYHSLEEIEQVPSGTVGPWAGGREHEKLGTTSTFSFLLGHISYVEDALVLPMMDYAFPLSHWDRTAYGSGSGGFFINFFNRVIYIDGEILYPSLSLFKKKKKQIGIWQLSNIFGWKGNYYSIENNILSTRDCIQVQRLK